MTYSTHFIYGNGVGQMAKDHSDSKKKPADATIWATLSD